MNRISPPRRAQRVRSGEIANLLIDEIDWRNGTVTLKGTKSRRQDILPLLMATGQALAD